MDLHCESSVTKICTVIFFPFFLGLEKRLNKTSQLASLGLNATQGLPVQTLPILTKSNIGNHDILMRNGLHKTHMDKD